MEYIYHLQLLVFHSTWFDQFVEVCTRYLWTTWEWTRDTPKGIPVVKVPAFWSCFLCGGEKVGISCAFRKRSGSKDTKFYQLCTSSEFDQTKRNLTTWMSNENMPVLFTFPNVGYPQPYLKLTANAPEKWWERKTFAFPFWGFGQFLGANS